MTAHPSRRLITVVAGTGVLGIALGTTGASLALWSDDVEMSGTVATGYEHFAVGAPGTQLAPAVAGAVPFDVGPAEAATLLAEGAIAVPIQVDSLSQGNKGLRYTVTAPDSWGDGVLGSSAPDVFRVAAVADCVPDARVPEPNLPFSIPVDATYTDTATVTTEYWCLVATLEAPDEGNYENTVTVTGIAPDGGTASASDDWQAEVVTGLEPSDEDVRTITFAYSTFRPGGELP